MKICHHCGAERTTREQPGFKETCPKCDSYLHACLNCRLYNPSADRCSSVTAECTGRRDGLNYCDEFQFKDVPNNTHHRNGTRDARPRRSGTSLGLFPPVDDVKPKPRGGGTARKKFDDLFGT